MKQKTQITINNLKQRIEKLYEREENKEVKEEIKTIKEESKTVSVLTKSIIKNVLIVANEPTKLRVPTFKKSKKVINIEQPSVS